VTHMDCDSLSDVAPELALEVLDGRERADALAHLEVCARCRRLVSTMAADADVLLLIAPPADPPPGFDQRVLRSLAARAKRTATPAVRRDRRGSDALPDRASEPRPSPPPPSRGRLRTPSRRRSRALASLALAASVAAVSFVLGTGTTPSPALATAEMRTGDGDVVGRVLVHTGDPAALLVTVPGWADEFGRYERADAAYSLRIERAGEPPQLVPYELDGEPTWGTTIDGDPDAITAVAVVDRAGRVWCEAEV
jgi:hypothetical protein